MRAARVPGFQLGYVRRGPPRNAVIAVAAVSIVANGLAWVLSTLFDNPGRIADDPLRGYLLSAGFAVGATAVTIISARVRDGPVPVFALAVCGLAMWSLLPATAFIGVWLVLLAGPLPLAFLGFPLLLAAAAWVLIRRDLVELGLAILSVALLIVPGGLALFAVPELPAGLWLPVLGWHLVLGIFAVTLLIRQPRPARRHPDAIRTR